jgi:hypothetical protein
LTIDSSQRSDDWPRLLQLAQQVRLETATDAFVDAVESWWSVTNLSKTEMLEVLRRCHNGLALSPAFDERDALEGVLTTVLSAWAAGAPSGEIEQ